MQKQHCVIDPPKMNTIMKEHHEIGEYLNTESLFVVKIIKEGDTIP